MSERMEHDERERIILNDLEASFPNFAGQSLQWITVPDGQEPPDFFSFSQEEPIGLELIEWLEGEQMERAKIRESKRKNILQVLAKNWENEYQPQNFEGAFIAIGSEEITRSDEALLRKEFFACAFDVDRTWFSNRDLIGRAYNQTEFSNYPLMERYISAIRYIAGDPHGFCWIDAQGYGASYDPEATVETLEQAINKKLNNNSTPEKQAHLKAHALVELYLLMHGSFNALAYNASSGWLSLRTIARRGSVFYAKHPQRQIFNRVWFFDSLDSADDINQLIGYPPGYGRVRWLAQLWPDFRIYPNSLPA